MLKDVEGNTALHYIVALGRDRLLRSYLKHLRRHEKENSVIIAEDPLESKNSVGECARTIALKNNDYICLQLINEEKMRRLKVLNKKIGLIQHSRMTPILARKGKAAKKYLQHYASFDSLFDDRKENSSEDELLGSGGSSDFTQSFRRLKDTTKYQSQPDHLDRTFGSKVCADVDIMPKVSIKVGVKVTNPTPPQQKPISRAAWIQPRSETVRSNSPLNFSSILRQEVTDSPIYAPCSPTTKSPQPLKSKVTDRIKNFLRRRPKYEVKDDESLPHCKRTFSDSTLDRPRTYADSTPSRPYTEENSSGPSRPIRGSRINLRLSESDAPSTMEESSVFFGDSFKERAKHDEILRKQPKEKKREITLPPIRNSHLLKSQSTEFGGIR